MAVLTTLVENLSTVGQWFFTNVFTDLFEVITSNDIILWPVLFAIVTGVVFYAIKIIRKFGLKGRR